MPRVHSYVHRPGFYVKSALSGAMITHRVTAAGCHYFRLQGIKDGDQITAQLFSELERTGKLKTGGSGTTVSENAPEDNVQRAARKSRGRHADIEARLAELGSEAHQMRLLRLAGRMICLAEGINPRIAHLTIPRGPKTAFTVVLRRVTVMSVASDGGVALLVHEPVVPYAILADLRDQRRVGRKREVKQRYHVIRHPS